MGNTSDIAGCAVRPSVLGSELLHCTLEPGVEAVGFLETLEIIGKPLELSLGIAKCLCEIFRPPDLFHPRLGKPPVEDFS